MKTTTSTTATGGFTRRLTELRAAVDQGWLTQGRRGIEKESLRVLPDGALAVTPHPVTLGAALTHPEITTDYSEALLEFITPPVADAAIALDELHTLHGFVHRQIGDELLWDVSMPGKLPADAGIPIAEYGRSNQGRFKHVYRQGLALRYGRAMQCIAGIHYNFSLHERVWPLLAETPNQADRAAPHDIQSDGYMGLIRNYRRYSWLLLYLFGASPALDRSFFGAPVAGEPDAGIARGLSALGADTLYLPYATSLRMSDLGYHNRRSSGITQPDLSSLDRYLASLAQAIQAPYAPYAEMGTHIDDEWVQLNTNLLQIENELYATIRPKRISWQGERPLHSLERCGIQYIEVRCLDIDPFEPVGISETTVRFLDAFLTMCVLEDSPRDTATQAEADVNFLDVAKSGRAPGKMLSRGGKQIALTEWADELMGRIEAVAALLDEARGDAAHAEALRLQRVKMADPSTLPSARALAAIEAEGSFTAFALGQSRRHAQHFRDMPLEESESARLLDLARESMVKQEAMEAADEIGFDEFVARYGSPQGRLESA